MFGNIVKNVHRCKCMVTIEYTKSSFLQLLSSTYCCAYINPLPVAAEIQNFKINSNRTFGFS